MTQPVVGPIPEWRSGPCTCDHAEQLEVTVEAIAPDWAWWLLLPHALTLLGLAYLILRGY